MVLTAGFCLLLMSPEVLLATEKTNRVDLNSTITFVSQWHRRCLLTSVLTYYLLRCATQYKWLRQITTGPTPFFKWNEHHTMSSVSLCDKWWLVWLMDWHCQANTQCHTIDFTHPGIVSSTPLITAKPRLVPNLLSLYFKIQHGSCGICMKTLGGWRQRSEKSSCPFVLHLSEVWCEAVRCSCHSYSPPSDSDFGAVCIVNNKCIYDVSYYLCGQHDQLIKCGSNSNHTPTPITTLKPNPTSLALALPLVLECSWLGSGP